MPLEVDAAYENGVLRPLQPLDLKEHEQVAVSVVQGVARDRSGLAVKDIEKIKRELPDAHPASGLEVRRARCGSRLHFAFLEQSKLLSKEKILGDQCPLGQLMGWSAKSNFWLTTIRKLSDNPSQTEVVLGAC